MPTNKEIAEELIRAAQNEEKNGKILLHLGKSDLWQECLLEAGYFRSLAAKVEQMRCETCKHYSEYIAKDKDNQPRLFNVCLEGYVRDQGPDFGCRKWEAKEE